MRASVSTRYRPPEGWKTNREETGGGVLLDVGIHYVDVLRSWFGEPTRVVAATGSQSFPITRGEEAGALLLQFPGGMVATIQVSWTAIGPVNTPNIEIFGERVPCNSRTTGPT